MAQAWQTKISMFSNQRCFSQAHSTDVVLSSLCPPRRWSGAGVGVGMLRGIPLLENKKGFLVFGFGFLVSKNVLCFQNIFVTYYQMSISCFLIDMKYISKILEILLDGSSSFVGARLFEKCQNVGCQKFSDMKNNMFLRCPHDSSCIFWSLFGITK